MKDPAELIKRFKSRVHVLDGGLATELEKRGHDISGKLWSAQVLLENPDAIEQLHYDYLKAGADIIITSSYQLTFQGMKEAGYTHEQAEDAFNKSVEVAVKARERYLAELDQDLPEDRKPLIAASIGPYGAYLADGSEYTGDYPSLLQLTYQEFVDKFLDFHEDRFKLLHESEADLFALETIPSTDEAEALMCLLEKYPTAPAWISFACKDKEHVVDGGDIEVQSFECTVVENLVAFGVNCSAPSNVTGLVNTSFPRCSQPKHGQAGPTTPIIAYPNSGEGWDAAHRCWVGENDAEHFAEHAREWIKAGANIIGGCCRTGPEHIAQLRALVDSMT
ncbi:MAG: homocysteine S-methyltransferase [Planctomycetes bacterium]|nr:homocysteine S-methyltransferase [Planctomycetota bacterium]